MQRKFLDLLVQQELEVLATDGTNLVNKFGTLYEHGRRFANLLSNKAAESRDRIRRLQEVLVRVMNRVLVFKGSRLDQALNYCDMTLLASMMQRVNN